MGVNGEVSRDQWAMEYLSMGALALCFTEHACGDARAGVDRGWNLGVGV